jgi:hypothetical protein
MVQNIMCMVKFQKEICEKILENKTLERSRGFHKLYKGALKSEKVLERSRMYCKV